MTDFRADPSDSPEGKAIARSAWDAYVEALRPVSDPVAQIVARKITGDIVGFWVMWHLCGGFEGLERYGMHKATIWRKVKKFRLVTGKHPDEYKFTGITIDRGAAWGALLGAESTQSAPANSAPARLTAMPQSPTRRRRFQRLGQIGTSSSRSCRTRLITHSQYRNGHAFGRVTAIVQSPDFNLDDLWDNASAKERRLIVEELIEAVTIYADRLDVTVTGVPALIIQHDEVGLRDPGTGHLVSKGGLELRVKDTRLVPPGVY